MKWRWIVGLKFLFLICGVILKILDWIVAFDVFCFSYEFTLNQDWKCLDLFTYHGYPVPFQNYDLIIPLILWKLAFEPFWEKKLESSLILCQRGIWYCKQYSACIKKRKKTLCAQLVSYTHAILVGKFTLSSLDDSAKIAFEISVRNNVVSIRIWKSFEVPQGRVHITRSG